jgi:heme ABC exporter ATP-binding subunit CcmA
MMSIHPSSPLSSQSWLEGVPESEAEVSSQPAVVVAVGELTKRYDLRPVLRNISYTLSAGKVLALFGPNGAGKTTLLRILATLAKPSEGWAHVDQRDVIADAAEVRRLIGYVGHQPGVYADLDGLENLLFFARMYGLRDGPERARRLLDQVGLRVKAKDRVRTYSRGQVQRLALARGLLHDPLLLLLDEPDTGLDEDAAVMLDRLIRDRREAGLTTIFTTHQLERGLDLADEALVLVGGRMAYAGTSPALGLVELRRLTKKGGVA